MKIEFRYHHRIASVIVAGALFAACNGSTVFGQVTPCVAPPTACTSVLACQSSANASRQNYFYESELNSGIIYNQYSGTYSTGAQPISPYYWSSEGDSIQISANYSIWGALIPSFHPDCGFTIIEDVYLVPVTPPNNTTNVVLAVFSNPLNGGIQVFSFDGAHFMITNALSRSTTVTGKATYTQTFWDPHVKTAAWYLLALTLRPDGKMRLDAFNWDGTQPSGRKFEWNEGLLEAGWPQLYTCTAAATEGSCTTPKALEGATSYLRVSMGLPYDPDNAQYLQSEGFPTTFTSGPSNWYLFRNYKRALTKDEIMSVWSQDAEGGRSFNPQGLILVQDSDLNGSLTPNTNKTQLYPCNTGMFLSPTSLFPNNYINTACISQKPLVSPPPIQFATAVLSFPTTFIGQTSTIVEKATNTTSTGMPRIRDGFTGTNARDLGLGANSCESIDSGAQCSAAITFSPLGTGTRTAAYVLMVIGGASQTAAIIGTGAQAFQVSTNSIGFPSTQPGTSSAPISMTITNTTSAPVSLSPLFGGTNSAEFSVTNNCSGSIDTGKTCTLNVVFSPQQTATGTQTATMTLPSAAWPAQVVSLTGTVEK
jgi:hypothetical protein